MGSNVLIKAPSNCARKPGPKADVKTPKARKHDAQPIAAIKAPNTPD